MIDKRVKNTAPRLGDPRQKDLRQNRPKRARVQALPAEDAPEKPKRLSRASTNPGLKKPEFPRNGKKPDAKPPRDEDSGMRIAKVMARAGLCSRRDAETWIEQGRVFLNGKVLTSPAINIGPRDQVSVDGEPLAPRERTRLFLFHKPRGLVTTDKDPEGRATIFDHLQRHWPDGPRIIAVGRLDINTEGLLLLTNDGGLARVLELPSTGWTRRYRVRANGKTDQAVLDRLRDGLTIDGIDYAGIEATLDRVQGDNVWLSLGLREGKNREIKRVLEHINLYVNRLIRVSFGPFQLGELAEGAVEEVKTRVLRDQLGPALAAEADADFESSVAARHQDPVPPQRARGRNESRPNDRAPRDKKGAREEQDRRAPQDKKGARGDRPESGRARKSVPMRPGTRQRDTGREIREAPLPVEPSFKPRGPHKHISAMRNGDEGKTGQGDRKRTLLSETADRKGRTVVVERKAKVVPRKLREEPAPDIKDARKPRGSGRPVRGGYGAPGKTRNAAQAPVWQDSTQHPAGVKGAARKPAFKGGHPAAARPKGASNKGARPARPGRPQRPR